MTEATIALEECLGKVGICLDVDFLRDGTALLVRGAARKLLCLFSGDQLARGRDLMAGIQA